ncbi:MAG TPA: malectin domain-containing carbohydrate-binding protein [Terriglobia bacterium]|nr:malectin domain-containing carbohydrate-binding protein [Terriglobia bacterium]
MPPETAFSDEKAELKRVLASPSFAKSPNLSRLLEYLCYKYIEGSGQELNEYSIAVDALGRTADFDPGTSSIVRVEAHRLREKLNKYYEGEGADHPLMIVLEAGHYVPHFVKREGLVPAALEIPSGRPVANGAGALPAGLASSTPQIVANPAVPGETDKTATGDSWGVGGSKLGMRLTIFAIGLVVVILILIVVSWRFEIRQSIGTSLAIPTGNSSAPGTAAPGDEIRILAGYSKENYIDRRGKVWQGDRYFKGGAPFASPQPTISRTLDPTIFQQSRVGEFAYDIPLKKGVYELRLYFAETEFAPTTFSGGGESSRIFDIDMNGKPLLVSFDIYRDAGGNNVAYERVFKDVAPTSDGYLHLRFRPASREKPTLNALEIVPGIPGKLLPIRLVAREGSYTDRAGQVWSPDRFFFHGRLASHKGPVQNTSDPDLYASERFGNFDYAIPVAPGKYGVTLHFAETYFGEANAGFGGIGSRIFDVYCNGVALLRNFDIFKEAGGANRAWDKTFHGLGPNGQSLLVLSFIPRENYAEVNAIEVMDESQ